MARISGVDLPREKRVEIGLTYIFGIGVKTSQEILAATGVNPDTRVKDLTEQDVNKIREYIEHNLKVEGDLRRDVSLDIKRMMEIPATERCGSRYLDSLCPNTCCLFLDAYCVGKHQILRKSSNFHKIPLVNHWIFRKISYLCPRIKAFFAYCKIQKRAEVRSFPYCYLYNIGKRPTS